MKLNSVDFVLHLSNYGLMYFAGEVPRGQKRKRDGDEGDDD